MSPTAQVLAELQKIHWFSELEEEHLRQIAEISFVRRVKAGEVIFHEGDKQDHIYVVVDGRVALDMFIPHRGKIRFYTADLKDTELYRRSLSLGLISSQRVVGAPAAIIRPRATSKA